MWEYNRVRGPWPDLLTQLNMKGRDGWEACAWSPCTPQPGEAHEQWAVLMRREIRDRPEVPAAPLRPPVAD